MAVKGRTNNPYGRPKGSTNRSTSLAREAIAKFVEDNSERFQGWLDSIAEDDPYKAFQCVKDLMEYHLPKLQRTESDVNNRYVDESGQDLHLKDREILKKMGIDIDDR